MRIAEKTVELNFCKGLPKALGRDLLWFGLTQKQEARAGFDACAKIGGKLFLFQVKASRILLSNGSRRFLAEHSQMQTLRDQATPSRQIYYVLPVVGTTLEICDGLCFSHCSRYLDVSRLPKTIPFPFAKGKSPPTVRKSNCHYIDVASTLNKATIHSKPFDADLLSIEGLVRSMELDAQSAGRVFHQDRRQAMEMPIRRSDEFDQFWSALCRVDRSGLFGAFAA